MVTKEAKFVHTISEISKTGQIRTWLFTKPVRAIMIVPE